MGAASSVARRFAPANDNAPPARPLMRLLAAAACLILAAAFMVYVHRL
ncbi:hypothetical protein GALL_271800 [mine drainage metagenome]|uniref:Uncharacterized protein n=1 Tax=mine drainage metagenome TaxID=410659 RepID=A0A1J5R668_9ZZZZ